MLPEGNTPLVRSTFLTHFIPCCLRDGPGVTAANIFLATTAT